MVTVTGWGVDLIYIIVFCYNLPHLKVNTPLPFSWGNLLCVNASYQPRPLFLVVYIHLGMVRPDTLKRFGLGKNKVHTRSLTARPCKNDGWKITFLLGWLIFRGYVKLPGSKNNSTTKYVDFWFDALMPSFWIFFGLSPIYQISQLYKPFTSSTILICPPILLSRVWDTSTSYAMNASAFWRRVK